MLPQVRCLTHRQSGWRLPAPTADGLRGQIPYSTPASYCHTRDSEYFLSNSISGMSSCGP